MSAISISLTLPQSQRTERFPLRLRSLVLALGFLATASAAAAPVSHSLQDQFGRAVTLALGAGRPAVVITSDRRGSPEDIAAWVKLLGPLPAGVTLYCLPNLKGLPFFVPQASVINKLRQSHPDLPMCLDWKGRTAASLGAPLNTAAVIVYGPGSGAAIGKVAGLASAAGLRRREPSSRRRSRPTEDRRS